MTTNKNQVNVFREPGILHPTLLVGWETQDVGNVGKEVINYIQEQCGGEEVAELDPMGFFAFEGAIFKDNLIQIPHSKFKECTEEKLLMFSSDEPMYEKYSFLTTVLDFCVEQYGVGSLYTFNGSPTPMAHTEERNMFLVFNRETLREEFPENEYIEHISWEGPPAMSTYLLWAALKKGISGITVWVEVPFYLSSVKDPLAVKCVLSFLDEHLNLGINLQQLDEEIDRQEELLLELTEANPEVREMLEKLEREEELEENEQIFLSKAVYDYLQKNNS